MVLWLGEGDAYALLGELLRAEYGLGVLPAMARGADGKPYFPGEPELHFNVSHSGGLALCGAGEAPLGVDVEVLRPRRPGLARYGCSEAESAWLERQGGDWGAFYTLWTLKEARVKCTGEGLRRPPRDIAVPLLRPGETGELMGWSFPPFPAKPGGRRPAAQPLRARWSSLLEILNGFLRIRARFSKESSFILIYEKEGTP